jgi:hypothetical protein
MVLEHKPYRGARWASVVSISAKIGSAAPTQHKWAKLAVADADGHSDVPDASLLCAVHLSI